MNQNHYPTPLLVSKHKTGPTIASPVMTENRILVPTYHGLHLFAYDDSCLVTKLDKHDGIFESTPVLLKGKAYISSKDGFLYCFGKKDAEE
jgi:outer membrane protein assembly factor BamB